MARHPVLDSGSPQKLFIMNSGIVASRYARALLKFVQETGNGDKVYAQAGILVLRMEEVARLKDCIENHNEISLEKKLQLLETALGEPVSMEMSRFLTLVVNQNRTAFFLRMLYDFITQYREANNIKVGRFVTAFPAEGLRERMEGFFSERTGAEVQLEMEVNPDILGGFVFELDGRMLDASVEGRFRQIRRKLIEKNSRLV